MYVPTMLRLKDAGLIKRWQKLAEYARRIPMTSEIILFADNSGLDWVLSANRDKRDLSMIFFTRYNQEDLECADDVKPGEEFHPVHTSYKVSEKYPFILRYIGTTHMKMHADGEITLADKGRLGFREKLKIIRTVFTTDAMIPSEQELDEILDYLRKANQENDG